MRCWLTHLRLPLLGLLFFTRLEAAPPCPTVFAGLTAADERTASVAVQTYGDLLDTVKDPAAKAKWLSAILSQQDPFATPQDTDLLVQQRHVEQFRKMLEALGYTRDSMRDLLLPVVAQRSGQVDKTSIEQATALQLNRPDFTEKLPAQLIGRTVSAHGRYLTGREGEKFWVADGETGKVFAGPEAPEGARLHISGDGHTAYASTAGGKALSVYQLEEDHFTLARTVPIAQSWWAKNVTGSEKSLCPGQPIPLANPNWVLSELRRGRNRPLSEPGLWLFNVQTGKVQMVNGTQGVLGMRGESSYGSTWTVAPGTNRIFIRVPDRKHRRMDIFFGDLGEDGRVKQWVSVGINTKMERTRQVMWASESHLAVRYLPDPKSMMLIPLDAGGVTIYADRHNGTWPSGMLFHSDGKTALANFEGDYQRIDLKTGEVTDTLVAPTDSWLSPDGDRLLSYVDGPLTNGPVLKSLRYDKRLKPHKP